MVSRSCVSYEAIAPLLGTANSDRQVLLALGWSDNRDDYVRLRDVARQFGLVLPSARCPAGSESPRGGAPSKFDDVRALRSAVGKRTSWAEILRALNAAPTGPNYERLDRACQRHGIELPPRKRVSRAHSRASKVNDLCASREQLDKAMTGSRSVAHALQRLGISAGGRVIAQVKAACLDHGVEIPLYDRSVGTERTARVDFAAVLVENGRPLTRSQKSRLVSEGLLANECEECRLPPEWNGKSLRLQIDHRNGVPTDNRLENLRLLCPNCHSQTSTFCGRNITQQAVPGAGLEPAISGTKARRHAN